MPFVYDMEVLNEEVKVEEGRVGPWIRKMETYLEAEMELLVQKQIHLPTNRHPTKPEDIVFHEKSSFFYIKQGEKNVGYMVCTPGNQKQIVWLSSFYIQKANRSMGIGSKALPLLKQILKKKGYSRLLLTVHSLNAQAEALYRANGINTEVWKSLMGEL